MLWCSLGCVVNEFALNLVFDDISNIYGYVPTSDRIAKMAHSSFLRDKGHCVRNICFIVQNPTKQWMGLHIYHPRRDLLYEPSESQWQAVTTSWNCNTCRFFHLYFTNHTWTIRYRCHHLNMPWNSVWNRKSGLRIREKGVQGYLAKIKHKYSMLFITDENE